jgi:hypothetical protein
MFGFSLQFLSLFFYSQLFQHQIHQGILYLAAPGNWRVPTIARIKIDVVSVAVPLQITAGLDMPLYELAAVQTLTSISMVLDSGRC